MQQKRGDNFPIPPLVPKIVPGSPQATLNNCIDYWKQTIKESKKKWVEDSECYDVVGYRFSLFYADEDGNKKLKTKMEGEKTERNAILDMIDLPPIYSNQTKPSTFQVIGFLECGLPQLEVTPEKTQIDWGEIIDVDVDVLCGQEGMPDELVYFSHQGPGMLEKDVIATDKSGHGKSLFHGTDTGIAKILTQVNACGIEGGPYEIVSGAFVSIGEQPNVWAITATITQQVNRMAEKSFDLGKTAVQPDHPLIKPGTYRIRKQNFLSSSISGSATFHLLVRHDTDDNSFVYSGETPVALMVFGTIGKKDREEKMEYINDEVSEFSTKRMDSYLGSFSTGSFEFQYTPDFQYVSAYASSEGKMLTKIKKYEDNKWKTNPSFYEYRTGIGGGWSTGDEGGIITRSKSGYSFTSRHTKREIKENPDFGTLTTVTTITLDGTITPLWKR